MADLVLSWLGSPNIRLGGQPVRLEMRKTLALLAFLSLRPHAHTREFLATLFWPEYSQQSALANLRRNLASLNKSLRFDFLEANRETVEFRKQAGVQVDVDEFRNYLERVNGHSHPNNELCLECQSSLENALIVYRGDFLEGFNLSDCPEFDEWQYYERDSLRRECCQALQILANCYAGEGQWEKAIAIARRWVLMGRLDEIAQRTLIRLYAGANQRSAALRQYEECEQILKSELGQPPEPETRKLYDEIRAGSVTDNGLSREPVFPQTPPNSTAAPLLRTKLRLPFLRLERVPRPRLHARIARGLRGPLTLITAPAGFGKTTLLSSCITDFGMPVAWLSLDRNDNQVERFLSYIVASLQEVDSAIGREAVRLLAAAQQSPHEAVLTSLINDLETADQDLTLVLDDYQFIHSHAVHESVAYLLEHCPKAFHLVVASRSDPPLPIARLRARGHAFELRAADLRFTEQEAAQFLNEVMGLSLDDSSVAALEERTEGWIAGLQMAALSMRDREDVLGFIEGFSGTNRYILDYLLEEVLVSQTPEIQRFLLRTSILERLTAPLCKAILEFDQLAGGAAPENMSSLPSSSLQTYQQALEYLEKANLFLVPLDDERQWYRYHHLFADLLRTQLQMSISVQGIAQLHVRASEWHAQNGSILEAINHASEAADEERVERFIAQNYMELVSRGEQSWMRIWTGKLNKELVYRRPWLCIYEAYSHSWFGELDEADRLLEEAERHIRSEMSVPDVRAMQGLLYYVKSRVTAMRGDIYRAIEFCLAAREGISAGNLALQLDTLITLGYEYFLNGDYSNAIPVLNEMIRSGVIAGAVMNTVAASCILARLYAVRGLLQKSYETYQMAAQSIPESGGQHLGARALVEIGIADVLCEWNELDAALSHLQQGLAQLAMWDKVDDWALAYTTLARIHLAQANQSDALAAVEKAIQFTQTRGIFSEARNAVEVAQVKMWLAQGDTQAAQRWAASWEERLSAQDQFGFENELTHITRARVLIAQSKPKEAIGLLSFLGEAARTAGRLGRVIEILLLKALALQMIDDRENAVLALTECLTLAETEGYARIFLDERQPLQALLDRWLADAGPGLLRDYASHLLSQFDAEPNMITTARVKSLPKDSPGGPEVIAVKDVLIEPLSQRELEVLHLIAMGMSNQEIAVQLIVAPGTVKAHAASIYRKLDVSNRTEAAARARQLRILN